MIPILVGCDPGVQQSALVVITAGARGRYHCLAHAIVDSDAESLAGFLDYAATLGAISAISIEWVDGFPFEGVRAKHLMQSQSVAAELSGIAYARGIRREKTQAQRWRDALVGRGPRVFAIPGMKKKASATDDRIAKMIPLLMTGTDGFPNASHVWDAAGVAVYGARLVWNPSRLLVAASHQSR